MQGMGDGVLIHVRKGDYAILETKEGYIISVLFPNAYRNSHFDVSRDFKLDISGLIQSGDFEALDALSQDIRRCYASFQRYETEKVNVTGRRLMSKLKLAIKPWISHYIGVGMIRMYSRLFSVRGITKSTLKDFSL